MHDAFAAVVVGMIPARLAGLVSPPPSISYFFQLFVWDKPWSHFHWFSVSSASHAPHLNQLSTFEFHPVFQELSFAFTEPALSLFSSETWAWICVIISSSRADISSSSISSTVLSGLKRDAFSLFLIFVLYLSASRLNLSLTERWVTVKCGLSIRFRLLEIKFHIHPLSGLPFYALNGCIRRTSHHVRKSTP